ncbi:hypothetical protein AAMO2058_001100900 [Amorphochlora amoebiformis]|eukprot:1013903-Amorphochlora_amoeboformis.AAC.1
MSKRTAIFSLKTILRQKLVVEILSAHRKQDPHMVLVLDEHTSKIVGSCATMSDLLSQGFVAIQNIELNRETIDLPATYFLDVSHAEDSKEDRKKLMLLAQDYSEGDGWNPTTKSGTKLKKKYLRAYVNVTLTLKKALISSILAKEKRFVSSCRALNEANVDFLSFESRVFLLNQPEALNILMKTGAEGIEESNRLIEQMTLQLVSLCIVLNESPYVRFENSQRGGRIEKLLAFMAGQDNFDAALQRTTRKLPNWKARPNPATLLFLNRTSDMAATLVHHLSYQSTLVDVMGMKGDVLEIEVDQKDESGVVIGSEKKSYVMSETDDVWRLKRHKHFDAVKNELYDEMQKFKSKSVAQNFKSKSDGLDIDQKTMLKVVKDIPKYREAVNMYKKHQNIIAKAREKIAERIGVTKLLQTLACLMDNTGNILRTSNIWEGVKTCLEDTKTSSTDKTSVALMYVIMRGGMTNSEKKVFEENLSSTTMTCIDSLKNLDLPTGKPQSDFKLRKDHVDIMKKNLKKRLQEKKEGKKAYTVGFRYIPRLEALVSQLADDKLDKKDFPYVKAPSKSSSRGTKSIGFSRRRNNKSGAAMVDPEKARLIIFVLGGITASEMASVYEIGTAFQTDIIIGSTAIITPNDVITSLSMGSNN